MSAAGPHDGARRLMRRHARGRLVLATIILFAASATAFAHAVLVESIPPGGGNVRPAPRYVLLRFNVRIEQALSLAQRFLRSHKIMDVDVGAVPADDATIFVAKRIRTAFLPAV